MSKPLSAVDCVSPAFAQTKKQLFAPVRFKRWFYLAIVCMTTGEFAGGGGGGGNFNFPITHGRGSKSLMALPHADWAQILPWLPWIVGAVVLILLLIFLWIYVAAVYRFVLFDSVLNDRCELKGSWRRWEPCGRSYFFWNICFFFVTSFATALVLGSPIVIAWQLGWFRHTAEHIAALILGGLAMFFVLVAFVVVSAIVGLFAKDFCIPIMAMERVGVVAAWRRLIPIVGSEKLAFTGYVLMKIVLAIGSAIIFGMITFLIMLCLFIPVGIAGAALFFAGKAMGLTFSIAIISVIAVLGFVFITVALFILGLISTPPMVFFQSYVINFIGSRYEPLRAILFPPPPEPSPSPEAFRLPLPEPPPEPAPAV